MAPIGISIFGILIILLLAGLTIGGIVLLITARRGGLGYPACGACHYDLSGTIGAGTRCPECGANIADAGITPPRGRRSPARLWIGIAMIALPLTCFGATLLAGVARVRQQQAASARANAAATANAQLKAQSAIVKSEQQAAAASIKRLQSQLESMQDEGKADADSLAAIQKEIDEFQRKLIELESREESVMIPNTEVSQSRTFEPNQPITPDER